MIQGSVERDVCPIGLAADLIGDKWSLIILRDIAIILRAGDGGSTLTAADIITDFTNGTDVLGLDDGLQYTDLNITQGTGDNANNTIISVKSGWEYLAILNNIDVSLIDEADFTPVDIA